MMYTGIVDLLTARLSDWHQDRTVCTYSPTFSFLSPAFVIDYMNHLWLLVNHVTVTPLTFTQHFSCGKMFSVGKLTHNSFDDSINQL